MTNHWEIIRWDRTLLEQLTNNTAHVLHWHLDDRVARMPITRKRIFILWMFFIIFCWFFFYRSVN